MTRVHVCPVDGCPLLAPCPVHGRHRNARWSKNRDPRHDTWARAAKRAQPYCSLCGATDKLDAHHLADGSPQVLCSSCHAKVDRHARAR